MTVLNEDVVALIREYVGATSLDVVNAYYELQRKDYPFLRDHINFKPRVKLILDLVKVIPNFYTKGKGVDSSEKHCLEQIMRWRYRNGYVSRVDTILAFSMLSKMNDTGQFPLKQQTFFQMQRVVKRVLHSKTRTHDINILNGSETPDAVKKIIDA